MTSFWLLVLIFSASLVESAKNTVSVKDYYGREVLLHYEPIDCFNDHAKPNRALRNLYYDARKNVLSWSRWPEITEEIIKRCATKAFEKGYTSIFGIQYYGECWSDGSAEMRFAMYGKSNKCVAGVGEAWTNFVYRLSVSHKTASKCFINGKQYEEGEVMSIPNDWSDDPANAMCMKCKCVEGQAKDCVVSYYCDTGLGGLCSKYRNASGSCCPVCDCYNDGQVMPMNSSWTVRNDRKECSLCTCGKNGIATCTHRKTCVCVGDHDEIPVPGQCCPKCVPRTTTTAAPPTVILPPTTERPPPVIPFPFP